jgi:hypothetical protein
MKNQPDEPAASYAARNRDLCSLLARSPAARTMNEGGNSGHFPVDVTWAPLNTARVSAATANMSSRRTRRFRQVVSALAVLGAVLNVWVLTVHATSLILNQLHANSEVSCHQGVPKIADDLGTGRTKPTPAKSCPICTGLASLHLGIISQPVLDVGSTAETGLDDGTTEAELVVDHRPRRILNRGPPLLT